MVLTDISWVPFYKYGLTIIQALITSNYILSKVWDESTYPFSNFNGCTVDVWNGLSNSTPHFIIDVIIAYILGLNLNNVSERDPWIIPVSAKGRFNRDVFHYEIEIGKV